MPCEAVKSARAKGDMGSHSVIRVMNFKCKYHIDLGGAQGGVHHQCRKKSAADLRTSK